MGIVTRRGEHKLADPNAALGAGRDSLYSPLRGTLNYENPLEVLGDTAGQAGDMIRAKVEDVVAFIKATTGIDLSGPAALLTLPIDTLGGTQLGQVLDVLGMFLPFLSGSDPSTFNTSTAAEQFITDILDPTGLLGGALDPLALLNAGNIIGVLRPENLPLIGTGLIGDISDNLLPNSILDGAGAILDGGGIWSIVTDHIYNVDPSRDVLGSLFAIPNGDLLEILSDPATPVKAGQVVAASQQVRWEAIPAGIVGDAFALAIEFYDRTGAYMSSSTVATIAAPPVDSSLHPLVGFGDFVNLQGEAPAPDGARWSRQRISIMPAVTSGTGVWFSDPILEKNNLVPHGYVSGIQGILDVGNALQTLLDKLGTGYTPGGTILSGVEFADLLYLAQQMTNKATDSLSLGQSLADIVNFRQNRPGLFGLQSTVESNIPFAQINRGTTPPTTVVGSATVAPAGVMRCQAADSKGFVQWLGVCGTTAPTDFRVNVYKMNSAGDFAWLHQSPNLAVGLPANGTTPIPWNTYTFAGTNQVPVVAGDVLRAEFIIVGGTFNFAGETGWAANHPTSKMKGFATSRNPATLGSIPNDGGFAGVRAANVAWSNAIPHVGFGISNVPPNYHPAETQPFNSAAGTFPIPIPAWAQVAGTLIDLIGVGGGGSGMSEADAGVMAGGTSGDWNVITLVYGVDIPLGTTALEVTVGAGGAQCTGYWQNGNNGADTVFRLGATVLLTCPHGLGGSGSVGLSSGTGEGAGDYPYNGTTYPGSTNVGINQPGSKPGGGGGGATWYQLGGAGGRGAGWAVVRQP